MHVGFFAVSVNFLTSCTFHIDLQTKLIKLVSRQLVAKSRLQAGAIPESLREYPKIKQWLRIVGVSDDTVEVQVKINQKYAELRCYFL